MAPGCAGIRRRSGEGVVSVPLKRSATASDITAVGVVMIAPALDLPCVRLAKRERVLPHLAYGSDVLGRSSLVILVV